MSWPKRRLAPRRCGRDLFDRLLTTRGSPRHPLNAEFLDDALRTMSVADRDLRCTEWVRRHQDETLGDLQRLEQRWRSDPACAAADRLLARWVKWMLTSTVRVLRDQATRTLYWFGRADPAALFDLAVDALDINDPYVSERMLAAGYGVAMALQHDSENGAFVDEVLPHAAEEIYAAMFASGAPHATTHLLARNYARRIVEISARHHPGRLTQEQLERTKPPYEDGGIRDWGESEDRNEGEYRDGNLPFGFLDDDPTDRLGPSISKYQSDTPQYKQAKANLWWRVYDLGYSLEKFGSVDGQLASSSYRRNSHEDGSWVDGYGRKYSWIATCELAGLRDDLGLLKSEWDDEQENWTHVDLDPSFPDRLSSYELVSGDLLGDREQNLRDWVSSGPSHTFEEILVLDDLQEERGPWVLLWGYLSQDDHGAKRRMFCFLQGALIDASKAEEVSRTVGRVENVDLHTMHVPDTHYTYAGEIPWCETYPVNEPFSVSITTGYETSVRTETETSYFRKDERISREEYFRAILERFAGDSSDDAEPHVGEPIFTRMERIAQEMGIRQVEESVTKEVEVPDAVVCDVTMPVRGHGWEDYHSELNPSTGANAPARQIADVLGLVGRPQTFDLYDSSGRRASATFRHGGRSSDKQEFTYLRKDLLDRYLKEAGQRLIWHIFGERAILEADPGARRASSDGPPYVRYDEVRMYD